MLKSMRNKLLSLPISLRRRAGALLFESSLHSLAHLGRLHPRARPRRHGVELLRDIDYGGYGEPGRREHTLDVYRPDRSGAAAPGPVVLYIHGGAFRFLSKDTHWVMALGFARKGCVVFNINYRLAPFHPFPAALEDCCRAYEWVVRHAADYGGDPRRLVVAGESAGANLATALTVAACYRRPEPYARRLFETGAVPRLAMPACGMLQVSDTERFLRRKKLPAWVGDRLLEVTESYLGRSRAESRELADPLLLLERGAPPDRPLPPFFVAVGTRDPLLDDTRRLKAALDRLAVPCEARYYEGELHAFHAMVWRKNARRCWQDKYDFLARYL